MLEVEDHVISACYASSVTEKTLLFCISPIDRFGLYAVTRRLLLKKLSTPESCEQVMRQIYVSTTNINDELIEKFYKELQNVTKVLNKDKITEMPRWRRCTR